MKKKRTPKMSRIKVSAFRRRIKELRRKKHPKSLASIEWNKSVTNCTIKQSDKKPIDISNLPKKRFPQTPSLHKKGSKLVYNKVTKKTERVWFESNFPDPHKVEASLWKNLGKAAKMKAYEDEKVKKWERKHPKPCPDDDLFKDELIPAWEHEREQAIERIRDFVVSMFDKLPLTGRYKEGENKFTEKPVTELKDKNEEGHKVNDLDPKKSKLLNKAQKATDKEKAKNTKLVATNLKDHKRKKGRIILPKAA